MPLSALSMAPAEQTALLDTLSQALREFLASPLRNIHLNVGPVRLYLRKSVRGFHLDSPPRRVHTLDIGSIDIEPTYQAQGLGAAVLARLHTDNPVEATLVESVSNPNLVRLLNRMGWLRATTCEFAPNFIRLTGREGKHDGVWYR